ncbi:HPP family protein [Halarcobacter anaerophilus]|jgi:CBS domain-containing protein|uniref:CBS domain-containing protein n=1 Tax=Halarcobacter anaerophilus TaxID=877500 RepID=UPI0005C87F62|nr:CBS domain-containing protein [Halarcobacter anaerophilus]
MFAIYNNNGLSFRSTVDNLYSLSNVDSIARSRNDVKEGLPKNHSSKRKKRIYEEASLEDATQIYKRVANLDTTQEIYHVQDLMTKEVVVLTQNSTLQEAYDLMEDKQIRQIPVLNNEDEKKIVAMVNQKNILNAVMDDIDFSSSTVKRTLASFDLGEVITADPITDIRRVAKVMVDFSLTAIPIVDQEDNLLGIVSRANILKAVANTPPLQIWG